MHHYSRSSRARQALVGLLAVSGLMAGCGSPLEVDLPPADAAIPSPPGLSWLSRSALDGFLDVSAFAGLHSGYVAIFARNGRVVHATTAGYADLASGRPMQIDTRFRMASMTKPVTAVAALILVEEGRLGLDDPVERYIPAAGRLRVATSRDRGADGTIPTAPLSHPITLRHLLTFTSGIGSGEDPSRLGQLWAERDIYAGRGSLEERVDRILSAPLYEQPGERWRYGWSADVLARVVEVAAGEPFDQLLARRIFMPLGMLSTGYLPPAGARDRIASMYTQDEEGELARVELPASDAPDWTPGGSGLVTTAADYMRFALMLWNAGRFDGTRILSPESVAHMTRPHVASGVLDSEDIEGLGWGLGVAVVVDADATPMSDRDGDFWWSGYYGTTFFVSPRTGLVGVVLTQNQPGPHSGRPYPVYIAQAFAFMGL